MGPPPLAMSIYAVVKDPRRGKRQGRDEPRAQGVRRRSISERCGVSRQAAHSGEARALKLLYRKEKRTFGV